MGKNIAVLMGGWSSEREISLSSGKACAKALREYGYNVKEIDVKRDLKDLISQLEPKPDVVFNALHGTGGEDGCIQGVLEILDIPYTHSSASASALCMNKQRTKDVLKAAKIKSPEGYLVDIDALRKGLLPLEAPYVVKPNSEGSSVGVFIIKEGDNKPAAGLDKWTYNPQALVEKYIPGRELSVAVLGSYKQKAKALTVTEIKTSSSFYDYEAKYDEGGSQHIVPAPVDQKIFDEAIRIATIAHEKLGCTGVTRSDFRYNDNESGVAGLFYLETNTQPGMTPTSLVPEQAAHKGMSFGELAVWLVENAAVHT